MLSQIPRCETNVKWHMELMDGTVLTPEQTLNDIGIESMDTGLFMWM
jgi:hypothetical protein